MKKQAKPFHSIDVQVVSYEYNVYDLLIYLPAYLFIDMLNQPLGEITKVEFTGLTHEPLILESEGDEGVTSLRTRLNQLYQISTLGRIYHDNLVASKATKVASTSALAMTAVVKVKTTINELELTHLITSLKAATPELADFKAKLENLPL